MPRSTASAKTTTRTPQRESFITDEKQIKTLDDLRLWNPFQRMTPTHLERLGRQSRKSVLDESEDALL